MLHMRIGSAWGHQFSFFEQDRRTPIRLNHRTIKVIIKKNKDDADESAILPILQYHQSKVNFVVPTYTADQTRNLKEGKYYFAIKMFTADKLDRELYNNIIVVEKGVFNE